MKNTSNEVRTLAEKILDQNIKGENLDVLGLVVPSYLEEVGLYGLGVSLVNSARVINDRIFSKSFEKFSHELKGLTPDQKIRFYERYSTKDIQEFGEQAILILNKIEMPLASKMMGKAHYLLVLGEISEDVYHNYCYIIKNINLYLFKEIKKIFTSSEVLFKNGVANNLYNLALLEEEYVNEFPTGPVFQGYKKSEFGNTFYFKIINPFVG